METITNDESIAISKWLRKLPVWQDYVLTDHDIAGIHTAIKEAVAAERKACADAVRPVPGLASGVPDGADIQSYALGYIQGRNDAVKAIEARESEEVDE